MERQKCRKKERIEYNCIQWSGKPEDIDNMLEWGNSKLIYISRGMMELIGVTTRPSIARPGYYLLKEKEEILIFEPKEFIKLYEIIP